MLICENPSLRCNIVGIGSFVYKLNGYLVINQRGVFLIKFSSIYSISEVERNLAGIVLETFMVKRLNPEQTRSSFEGEVR